MHRLMLRTESTSVQVRTVAPDVARFRWDDNLPEFFCTNTVVKVITSSGFEGVAGVSNYTNYDFDRYTAECTRHIIPILLGQDALMREQLHRMCSSRVWPYPVSNGGPGLLHVAALPACALC